MMKSEDPKVREQYFRLSTIHNLRFTIRMMEEVRQAILDGTFQEYKEQFLKDYYGTKKKG